MTTKNRSLSDSFSKKYNGIDEVWRWLTGSKGPVIRAAALAIFAADEIYVYLNGASSSVASECVESKVELHLRAARLACKNFAPNCFVSILRSNQDSLNQLKKEIEKHFPVKEGAR